MQLPAVSTQTEAPSYKDNAIPNAWEGAIIRLMQSAMMRTTDVPTNTEPAPTVKATPQATTPREPVDVAMESVSSQTTPRSKRQTRDQDEHPEDLFNLETGTPGTAAAVSTATAGTGLTRSGFTNFVRPSNPACDGSRKGLDGRDRRACNEQGHKYRGKPRWCPEGGDVMPFRTMGILNPR
ncbi:unnamed protein product [Phytophthora fragariaefolia]|uniref:Unnamed protein product n=1 Tax=Phytophthora fragariaefolia TaxID=1490495 RepID=A0A9W6YHY0_9STRA|nr:unnamed protein product [Phytophthora fragariaefolia]